MKFDKVRKGMILGSITESGNHKALAVVVVTHVEYDETYGRTVCGYWYVPNLGSFSWPSFAAWDNWTQIGRANKWALEQKMHCT